MLEPFCLGAGDVVMPLGSNRDVCRRKGEGTEPELCQHLDASFAQASSSSARCVPRTVPLGGGPALSRASPFC